MNPNLTFLNSFVNVSDETLQELKSISEYKKIASGTQIVTLNEIPSKVYLLISGVIRCYLITESGKEFNKSFYVPISFVGSLTALIKRKPSYFAFEALTDCKVYEVDYVKLMELCKNDNEVNRLYSSVLEVVYVKYERRLIELISLDATQRYLELKRQIPDLEKQINQYHIASYLGITAVQLSRIRKKIEGY